MMAKHYAEGSTIHCEGANGNDYTLCGFALEGETGNQPLDRTEAQITCRECIGIINFCRQIRAGEIAAPFQRRKVS